MTQNPFPGPQPYRATDRDRFYGRDDIAYLLEASILANRCVTVYGPSGAGKSSLVQASVIPGLVESKEIRVVRVDSWPEGEDPTSWLARAMYTDLGFAEPPADASSDAAILTAVQRVARASARLMLIYLDQLEQLLYPGRSVEQTDAFFASVGRLLDLPLRNARMVLSLREDYLGRFRDRLRDQHRILDHGFRVGPLTVAQLTEAVCQAAAAGEPPQTWSRSQMRSLMVQVRVPGQAASDASEAQSAYAQIVCRALFQQRAQGEEGAGGAEGEIQAEPILRRYFEVTLEQLGALRAAAQRLLEDHLVTADGSRTLRTEKELLRILPAEELSPILRALEGAAILHAEEHQGSRYFELGHDWLARWVYEQREVREREDALSRERKEAAARLAKERAQRRTFLAIAIASLTALVVTGVLGFLAFQAKREADRARADAELRRRDAEVKERAAHDAGLMTGFRELDVRGELPWAVKLLPEVIEPSKQRGWIEAASDALNRNALRATLLGHEGALSAAVFSPGGARVLTASSDKTARLWNAHGTGAPVVLKGHEGALTGAAWSPDERRVLTVSEDATARIWQADGRGEAVVLKGHTAAIVAGAWSPDGTRVATASLDGTARIWQADGGGAPIVLQGDKKPMSCVAFAPAAAADAKPGAPAPPQRVLTASEGGTVTVWDGGASGEHVDFKRHKDTVYVAAWSPDGARIVTASRDKTAFIWDWKGGGRAIELKDARRPQGFVFHAAWSPDGLFVATASSDRNARVFRADGKGEPVLLEGHTGFVTYVAFRPLSTAASEPAQGERDMAAALSRHDVATASFDNTARLWRADGSVKPLVLRGHQARVGSVVWSPDGTRVLTAASDQAAQDRTAKVWSAEPLRWLPRKEHVAGVPHAAFLDAAGERIVLAYDDNTARLVRVDSAAPPRVFQVVDGEGKPIAPGHAAGWIASAALSLDGKQVVAASFDGTARVWSAEGAGDPLMLVGDGAPVPLAAWNEKTPEERDALVATGHRAPVRFAAFSPDGKRVVTAADDGIARVWRLDGAGPQVVLRGHEDWLTSAAWSPDGTRIVTTAMDHTARIWSAEGGALTVLSGHKADVLAAEFSPDNKRVITASEDGTARIWSVDGGEAPLVLGGHNGPVLAAIWSSNGKRVATSSTDSRVRVWDANQGGAPLELEAQSPVLAMRFLASDQKIVAVAADGSARAWLIDVDVLKERLRMAHADCLPEAMRAKFLREDGEAVKKNYSACEASFQRRPEATP